MSTSDSAANYSVGDRFTVGGCADNVKAGVVLESCGWDSVKNDYIYKVEYYRKGRENWTMPVEGGGSATGTVWAKEIPKQDRQKATIGEKDMTAGDIPEYRAPALCNA